METRFLLPVNFKKIGWIFILLGMVIMIFSMFFDQGIPLFDGIPVFAIYTNGLGSEVQSGFFKIIKDDIDFELYTLFMIVGSLMVAFSKRKNEDEFMLKLRLESLVWATYVQYILLALSIIFIYGTPFINILVWNLFTMLLLFIAKFNFELFRTNKALKHEK